MSKWCEVEQSDVEDALASYVPPEALAGDSPAQADVPASSSVDGPAVLSPGPAAHMPPDVYNALSWAVRSNDSATEELLLSLVLAKADEYRAWKFPTSG